MWGFFFSKKQNKRNKPVPEPWLQKHIDKLALNDFQARSCWSVCVA